MRRMADDEVVRRTVAAVSSKNSQHRVERRARTHDRLGFRRVGQVVAADVHRLALNFLELFDDLRLVLGQRLGQRREVGLQFRVLALRGQGLRPVQRQVEVAATVVEFAGAGRWRLVIVEQLAGGFVQGLGQQLGFRVAGLDAHVFQRHGQGQEFAQGIPAQMVFFHQLLDVFRSRTARARFVHAATGHQWHDRQHLGAGAKFHDREQVGQVVAQDVAGHRDGVQAAPCTFQGVAHGAYLRHDLDVQAVGVVVFQVGLYLLDHFVFVWTVWVQPEHGRHAGVAGTGDGQLDPVADRGILDLAHAPDIAFFDVLRQQHFARYQVGDVGNAGFRHFKRLVVRTVFFRLLRHQAHVRHGTHGARVEVAMPFAEVDHFLVDTGKGALWHDCLGIFRTAIGAPHLAADTDHGWHRCVDDDVVRRMEVGDALGRIDHGQFWTVGVAGVQVFQDFIFLRRWQGFNLVVQIDHAVVDVHAQFFEQRGVLGERVLVENAHAMAEHDRVRYLHHGRLDVQREHHARLVRIFQFFFIELEQRFFAHEHAVDDFAGLQRDLRFQYDGFARSGDQFHLDIARVFQGQRFFAVVEVAVVHMRNVGARSLAPLAHRMRMLACKLFHGFWRAAIGIAFTQDRVDRAADAFAVA